MQGLVEAATKVAAVLEINHDDICNEVRRVQKEHNAAVDACATVTPETSESLAMADNADNDGRERPVVSAPVSWSPTATTMDNDGPNTEMTTCLDGGISINTGGADKDVVVMGPGDGIVIAAASTEPQRNMGGRPIGSTNANKQKNEWKWKQAINWVVIQYSEEKEKVDAANETSAKQIQVSSGMLKVLIEETRITFGLTCDFNVPYQTIVSRIKSGNLEVLHPGEKSMLLHMEVVLKAYLITAADLSCALNVSETIAFANDLIEGTKIADKFIAWKKKRGIYNANAETLGRKWYRLFMNRNSDIVTRVGDNLEQNRFDHINYPAFFKMFNQIEAALLKLGNAHKFGSPVHMDAAGNIVEDESLAVGHPVTVDIIDRDNCFCFDETGDNTHGKSDSRRGGERFVVAKGQAAKNVVGTNDSHFTVVPITNLNGCMVMLVIIFAAKKLPKSWCLGIDVFADYDEDNYENNFGIGRRYPGLQLFREDGTIIPICWAASPKACMTGEILTLVFRQMDKLGITKRGFNENGSPVTPLVILDGHPSRMDSEFLTYINEITSKWTAVLGAPYGTSKWQLHDDEAQNGSFKIALANAKKKMYLKKRVNGLPIAIKPQEIVLVVKDAVDLSFMSIDNTLSACCKRGMYPFNRNPLDDPEVLRSAPDNVRLERIVVLQRRGITHDAIPLSEANLLEIGSGHLAGGVNATEGLAQTLHDLNHMNATTANIFKLSELAKNTAVGRMRHNLLDSSSRGGTWLHQD